MSSLAVWSAIVLVWGGREKLITDIKGKERKIILSLIGLVMENKGSKRPVMCWLIFQRWWITGTRVWRCSKVLKNTTCSAPLQCRLSSVHTYCPSPSLLSEKQSVYFLQYVPENEKHEKRNPPISFLSDWLWWGAASLPLTSTSAPIGLCLTMSFLVFTERCETFWVQVVSVCRSHLIPALHFLPSCLLFTHL